MRVRLKGTLLGAGDPIGPGEIVDLPRERAEKMIKRGKAVRVVKTLRIGVQLDSVEVGKYER